MKHTTDSENEGKRKTLAKGWKIAIAVVVSAVLLCGVGFGIAVAVSYIEAANFDVSGTPFESPYRLDENGYFVENIPYGDYLVYDAALDRDPTARQPVLSDDADPGKRRGSAFVYSRDIYDKPAKIQQRRQTIKRPANLRDVLQSMHVSGVYSNFLVKQTIVFASVKPQSR